MREYDGIYDKALANTIESDSLRDEFTQYADEKCEQLDPDNPDAEATIILIRHKLKYALEGMPFLFLDQDRRTIGELNQWFTINDAREHKKKKLSREEKDAILSTFQFLSTWCVDQAAYIDGTSGPEFGRLRRETARRVYTHLTEMKVRRRRKD